jgi:ABC-type phosphate transport system substrate-binding protein
LLDGLMGEAMILDFTREKLRGAFEGKMSKWKHPNGGDACDRSTAPLEKRP